MASPTTKELDIIGVRVKKLLLALVTFTISCTSQTMVIDFPTCAVVDSITQDTTQVASFDYSCP